MIGNMGNNIFPMRMGEIIRCYVLGYQESISKSRILASVVFERILDGLSVFIFFMLGLFFTDSGEIFVDGAIILFSIFGSIFILLFISKRYQEFSFKIVVFLLHFFSQNTKTRVKDKLGSFFSGLEIFHNKKYFFISVLYSLLLWTLGITGTYFLLTSASDSVPIHLPLILTSALVVGVMIPSAPGFIGTYHYVAIVVLGLYSWEQELAAVTSVVLHGIQFLIPIIIGLILTLKLGYSFKDLTGEDIKV